MSEHAKEQDARNTPVRVTTDAILRDDKPFAIPASPSSFQASALSSSPTRRAVRPPIHNPRTNQPPSSRRAPAWQQLEATPPSSSDFTHRRSSSWDGRQRAAIRHIEASSPEAQTPAASHAAAAMMYLSGFGRAVPSTKTASPPLVAKSISVPVASTRTTATPPSTPPPDRASPLVVASPSKLSLVMQQLDDVNSELDVITRTAGKITLIVDPPQGAAPKPDKLRPFRPVFLRADSPGEFETNPPQHATVVYGRRNSTNASSIMPSIDADSCLSPSAFAPAL